MNGGDISIENVNQEEFDGWDQRRRDWLIFNTLRSLSHQCKTRPCYCDKKYIGRKHFIYSGILVLGIFLGLGYVQVEWILPHIVRAAIGTILP